MSPGRRSVLRAVGTVGLAAVCGCASADRDSGGETPTATALPVETSRPSDSPAETHGRADYYPEPTSVEEPSAAVSLLETTGDDSPIAYDLEVVQRLATTASPPRLAVEATNTADRPFGVGEAGAMRFWGARGGEGHELVLLPPDHAGKVGYLDGRPTGEGSCWHLDSRVVRSTEYRFERLDPGEAIGAELEVWWDGAVDTCFPVGSFEFALAYDVWDPDSDAQPGDGDRYQFGFALGVERP